MSPLRTRSVAPWVLGALACILGLGLWIAGMKAGRSEVGSLQVVREETASAYLTSPHPEDLAADARMPSPRRDDEPAHTGIESLSRTVFLRGSLTLADGDAALPPADGRLELTVWGPSVSMHHAAKLGPRNAGLRERLRRRHVTTVDVHAGRWEARVPEHASRSFTSGRLAGSPLFDLRAQELETDDPTVLEFLVTGRALYPGHLSVVDRESGRPLGEVGIVALERGDPRLHPGALAPTIEGASPLEIQAGSVDRASYLVGSSGHAWLRVEWDHLVPAAKLIELERSATIAVRVVVDRLPGTWEVALSTSDGVPYGRLPAASSLPLRFDGIAPGAYRVELVPLSDSVQAQIPALATTCAIATAGQVTEVVLRATLGERPREVELAGRIHMSDAWSGGGPHLVLRALGTTVVWHAESEGMLDGVEVAREGDAWTFRSSRAIPGGTYVLTERRTWYTREIEVDAEGTRDLEFEIPAPLAVRVEVVDAESGAPIPGSELAWLPPAAPSRPRARATGAPWIQATDGVFRTLVPTLDLLEFEARAPDHAPALGVLRPHAEPARLRIALHRR